MHPNFIALIAPADALAMATPMATVADVPSKLDYLRLLLQELPKSIIEGNKFYNKSRFAVTARDNDDSDGTQIGALHRRLEIVFGEIKPDKHTGFIERGQGLVDLVAILQDAFENKTGDKLIIRRWVEYLTASALNMYQGAKQTPPASKRVPVASKRARDIVTEDSAVIKPPRAAPIQQKITEPKKSIGTPSTKSSSTDITTFFPPKTGSASSEAGHEPPLPQVKAASAKKRKASNVVIDSDDDVDYQPPKKSPRPIVVDSSSESDAVEQSDGESALRAVEKADDAVRARGTRRGPKNNTLKYWSTPYKIEREKNLFWEFRCRICNAIRSVRRSANCESFDNEPKLPGLSNLTSHIHEKHKDAEKQLEAVSGTDAVPAAHGYTAASAALMGQWLEKGALHPKLMKSYKGFLRHFAAWIIDENMPFSSGESWSLQNLFRYLDVTYSLPSDTTVRNELARLYTDLHGVVVKELSNVTSRIAYSNDTWTTDQMVFTFAGTIASFIDEDWNLLERVVDMAVLEDNQHEGVHAAAAFVDSLANRGGAHKMLSITMDNASSNDVLARSVGILVMKRYGLNIHPDNSRIRCMPHVVNLIVQKILATLEEADDPDVVDYFLSAKGGPVHYDPEQDPHQRKMDDDADAEDKALRKDEALDNISTAAATRRSELNDLIAALEQHKAKDSVNSPIKRLRVICNKIVSSPQRRSKFRRHVQMQYPDNPKLHRLMVIRDVKTRWNSTHAMIQRALRFRKAIDAWVFEHRDDLGIDVSLSRQDWDTLKHIEDLLNIFPEVTLHMSQNGQPTLPWVLPMYDLMEQDLLSRTSNLEVPESIRIAALAGLEKLGHYYGLAKSCQYNWIATALHPALRNWAKVHNLGPRSTAILTHAFNAYRETYPADKVPQPRTTVEKGSLLDRVMGGVSAEPPDEDAGQSEIERYFNGFDIKSSVADNALMWWKKHQLDLPILAKMARDFLAIPASSVSVERLFSDAGGLVTKERSSLSAETIRRCMCTKRWVRDGLMQRL